MYTSRKRIDNTKNMQASAVQQAAGAYIGAICEKDIPFLYAKSIPFYPGEIIGGFLVENKLISLFHAQVYTDAWEDYQRSLRKSGIACWDYIILTASNEQQAEGFRTQIRERKEAGFLPPKTHFAVIPDPDGKRVGSGGATLNVLRYIAEREKRADFKGLRVMVIHSGGDSKRIPQYSAMGKLFSPVPRTLPNGNASTLFDEFLISMAGIPSRIREGMLLLSGDVLLLFNPLLVDYPGDGAAALSFKEHVDTGKNHGVYLRGKDGCVARCLQKQSVEALRAAGAVNKDDHVDIDTGAVIFSPEMMASLYGLISVNGAADGSLFEAYVNENVRLSLYADFLYPLGTEATLEEFYREKPEGEYSEDLKNARTAVWDALRPYRMKLLRLAPARFVHFGTTGEIMQLLSEEIGQYSQLGWSSCVNSSITHGGVAGYNSVLSSRAVCGNGTYLECSYVHSRAKIGSHSLLSYVDIQDETIPDGVVLHCLKQKDGQFVARIYGTGDDPKGRLENECRFLTSTLEDFLKKSGVQETEVWKEKDHSLWTAELYPVCRTIREAVHAALNIYDLCMGEGNIQEWRHGQKKSLYSSFQDADPNALLAWDKHMQEIIAVDALVKKIQAFEPASTVKGYFKNRKLTKTQREWLTAKLKRTDFSEAMRLYYYIGMALGGDEGEQYCNECFRIISDSIQGEAMELLEENRECRICCDKHAVQLPLRVNWGGGWSDTPPYCNEKGGTVLNAAILLNGSLPVEVILERLEEEKIVFHSNDMESHGEFTEICELQRVGDPYDPFVLQKAALLACGIIPAKGGNLGNIFKRLGGGLRMQSEVTGVPKGSGLGTSSILAAACVKALLEFTGVKYTESDLYKRVLLMEQIMSTGGGWQDQVGGVTPGIKYITSMPGLRQDIKVQHLEIPEEARDELKKRFCLIYTGQRRLARNLLRDVVGRYIGNEPEALYALNEIQRTAALMRFELERGHIDAFAKLMSEHWELSKKLDYGSTNILIDQIFDSIDEFVDGKMICGAGGGGFLQVVLKQGADKGNIERRLRSVFQDSEIRVWNCELI